MVDTPKTLKGVLVVTGLVVAAILFLFTTNLISFLVGVVLFAAVLYALYALAVRGHRLAVGEYRRRGGA